MTSNSDKLRGLILAALMVFSVFAGTIALSGSAAATVGNSDVDLTLQPTDVEESAEDVTHEYEVSFDNIAGNSDVDVTLTAPAGTVDDSASTASVTDDNDDPVPVTVDSDDGTSDTVTITIDQGDLTTNADGAGYTLSGDLVIDYTSVDRANGPVDVDVDDGDTIGEDSSADVAVGASPLDSSSTFYTGQPVFVEGLDGDTAGDEYRVLTVDGDDNPGNLVRLVTAEDTTGDGTPDTIDFDLDGDLAEGDFVVVNDDGNPIEVTGGDFTGVDTGTDGTTTVNNNGGDSSLDGGEDLADGEQFEVVAQDLTAEFDDSSVGNDGTASTVDYEIDSNVRGDYRVNLSAQGDLDVEELTDIVETEGDLAVITEYEDEDTITVRASGSNSAEGDPLVLNFDDIDADTYTFTANVTDTGATATDDIEVTDTGNAQAGFADNIFQTARGDVVNITVEMEGTDTALVQVGGVDNDGYGALVEVTDDDEDGLAYIEFNSFIAGDGDSDTIVAGDDDTDVSNFQEFGSFDRDAPSDLTDSPEDDGLSSPDDLPEEGDLLDAGDYDLLAVEGDADDIDTSLIDANGDSDDEGLTRGESDNRASLSMDEPSVEGVEIFTAPADILSDLQSADAEDLPAYQNASNLTEASTIAKSDTVVVQIQASGLEGAFESGDYLSLSDVGTGIDTEDDSGIFTTVLEEDDAPNAATGEVTLQNIQDASGSDGVTVLYDGDADVHYAIFNSDDLAAAATGSFEDGDEFIANFTTYDDNSELFGDNSATDGFSVDDGQAELDTERNDAGEDIIRVGQADGEQVTGTTNLAPGTEIEVEFDSESSSDPFVKRPEAVVDRDGSFTVVADFGDNDVGTNFTAEPIQNDIADPELDTNEVNGLIVESTGTDVTDTATPEPDTDTATPEPDTGTATPMDMGTDTATPMDMGTDTETPMDMDTATDTATEDGNATEEATGGSGPGFTAALALIALVAAALLAVRRNN